MIAYKPENGNSPWVCLVGKYNTIWIAYQTEEMAKANLPKLIEGFKNHG